jgi:hypothetical protein
MRGYRCRDSQDDVAVALARPPHGPEPVDPDLIQPDGPLAALVGLGLDGTLPTGSVRAIASNCSTPIAMRTMRSGPPPRHRNDLGRLVFAASLAPAIRYILGGKHGNKANEPSPNRKGDD